ncbi:hypothetical protein ASPWEDRAFT_65656 [Aspergillus wentii DTO 134E9]|uniref:SNF2 N-terminal domain-containing protein n=1 Tax=Aspergillus wentii DTO 134E9 TaxID=1073089 RepID=A0A1L9RUR8_ASPWE|nr:uncharacterized protein ASPWEDRAFT_65656 [Aspergillus wentii DTO 134E9]KAI9928592.1 hypothetical protein MW887_001807 [Aspergillus wentii]OJJ38666.1 hypothetical protein ASPWEDRAFT_65656 [Aspergillus wentii DTO 134E9]
MGTGKTKLAVLVMEMAKNERGCFSLVVCPASCREQLETRDLGHLQGRLRTKGSYTEESKNAARQLVEDKWKIIIISYDFLAANHEAIEEFPKYLTKFKGGDRWPVRPIAAICTDFWKLHNLPIKWVVLDECHRIKRDDVVFYKAACSLFHNGIVVLLGTVLSNIWHDIANPITLLQGQLFQTKQQFINADNETSAIGALSGCEDFFWPSVSSTGYPAYFPVRVV